MRWFSGCYQNRKSCISITVLFLGCVCFYFTSRKHHIQQIEFRSRTSPRLPLYADSQGDTQKLELLNTFASKCLHHGIPIFVIEPSVLHHLLSANESEPPCILCSAGDVISLGVFGADWDKGESLLLEFNDLDIVLNEVTAPDPRLLSLERITVPSVPTHYLIRQSGSLPLHLVVFYERDDNYWWHSSLEPSTTSNSQIFQGLNTTFGNSAGAYDRFDVRLTTVDGMWLYLPHPVGEFLAQMPRSKFIECDYQGAQTYLSKNSAERSGLTLHGAKVLYQAKRALDPLGVPFWLSFGTCLGWYRQCGFIPYTSDIDIEIPIQRYSTGILPAFLKAGFKLLHVKGKMSDSFEMAIKAHGIKIDVSFVYEEKTYLWQGGTDAHDGKKYKYTFPKFDTCWTDFMGCRLRVPCPTLPYITAAYGKNWNTSVKQWDWRGSGSNAQKNGVWPKEEWQTVIQGTH
ncbi:ribitol-5-phosphate transferase FKTN-like [Haliotis rufescens]|uniref:ribitol-5-phosphate transferase FKTN-like n=1 Tax=Haliotis rufescens TaxID=6454 RepID=UPI00201F5C60|nr:ribitol-5-phosphate transferase FKTN-like [Haliotis rufescens]